MVWVGNGVGGVCSTVSAAVSDWAAWKISGSRSRCKAWPHCGCGCAGPGSWSWRMTWRSEDTCEVWPLCATWSGSACQTYWRRSPHTSGTYRRRDRNGRTGWKYKEEEEEGDVQEEEKKKERRWDRRRLGDRVMEQWPTERNKISQKMKRKKKKKKSMKTKAG